MEQSNIYKLQTDNDNSISINLNDIQGISNVQEYHVYGNVPGYTVYIDNWKFDCIMRPDFCSHGEIDMKSEVIKQRSDLLRAWSKVVDQG